MGNSFTTTPAEAASDRKLEAVNEILEALGEPPVEELDTGGTSEVADAERFLDRASKRIQMRGWAANTTLEKVYSPDSSGEISLTDVLKIRPVLGGYGNIERQTDPTKRYVIRDGKLYDVIESTGTFTSDVRLEVVELVAFESLPTSLAAYIVAVASVDFQRYLKRDAIDDAFLRDELAAAKIAAQQEDGDLRNVNVLATPEAHRVRGSRRTYPGA